MVDINLLPSDLTPKKAIIKVSKTVKKVSIIGYSAIIVLALIFGGAYILLFNQITKTERSQSDLKNTISSLEQTEQRLILVKDRLAKVDQVMKKPSANLEVDNLEILKSLFPEGFSISEAEITNKGNEMKFRVPSSKALVEFLANLFSSGTYRNIVMMEFEYRKSTGYLLTLKLVS